MRGAVTAVYVVAGLAVVASIVLVVALVTRDFSNHYVYDYTSRSLSLAYTVSAFWAGNAGSLLLWLLLMADLLSRRAPADPQGGPALCPVCDGHPAGDHHLLLAADRVRERFQPVSSRCSRRIAGRFPPTARA